MSTTRGSAIAAAGKAALAALRAENRAAAARLRACHALHDLCEEEQLVRDLEAGYYEPDGPERRPDHAVLDPFHVACAELVATYGVHHNRASAMLTLARDLVTRYPGIVEAMEAGLLDEYTAGMLARHMRTVDSSVIDSVHRLVVDWLLDSIASGDRPGRAAILAQTDRIIAAHDPEGVLARAAAAVRERRVRIRRAVDGMADVHAHLTAAEAGALNEVLEQTVREGLTREKEARVEAVRNGDDQPFDADAHRSNDERRADALVDAILGTGSGDSSCDAQRGTPAPQIRPSITVLGPFGPGDEPEIYLPRGGPATIDALIALLTRSVGATISVPDPRPGTADSPTGARRYRISAELARRIRLRDGTCRHPGCSVPADDCDVDHAVPFDHSDPGKGGLTVEANLMCLCRRHHRLKTFHTWHYRLARDGTLTVTTDTGHTLTTDPQGPLARWRQLTATDSEPLTGAGADKRPWLNPRPRSTHWFLRTCRIAAERRDNAAAARADTAGERRSDRSGEPDPDPPPF